MHNEMLARVVAVCRQRIKEGDCPTVPPFPSETLEDAVVALADRLFVMLDDGPDTAGNIPPTTTTAAEAAESGAREKGACPECGCEELDHRGLWTCRCPASAPASDGDPAEGTDTSYTGQIATLRKQLAAAEAKLDAAMRERDEARRILRDCYTGWSNGADVFGPMQIALKYLADLDWAAARALIAESGSKTAAPRGAL